MRKRGPVHYSIERIKPSKAPTSGKLVRSRPMKKMKPKK